MVFNRYGLHPYVQNVAGSWFSVAEEGTSSMVISCNDYDSGYVSDYDSIYDQNIVFYDEDEVEFDDGSYGDLEDYDSDDYILEEIPFVYCPSYDEFVEA